MPDTPTCERILEAALGCFDRQGIDAVSLRQVAKEAGITPMAVYRHYDDKAALLEAVIERGFAVYAGYLGEAGCHGDALLAMRRRAERVFDFAIEQPAFFELMFLSLRSTARLISAERLRRLHAPTYRVAFEAVRECRRSGQLVKSEDRVMTRSLLAYCIGYCTFQTRGTLGLSDQAAKAEYLKGFDALLS